MRDNRDEVIHHQLSQLAEMPTVSPFCETFYQLIAQYACPGRCGDENIGRLFARFLGIELRYHGQIDRANRREDVRTGEVQSLADKRQIGLASLAEEVRAVRCQSRDDEIARQLILAECYYHTHQTKKVIAHLEAAARQDSDEPLILFALGYNRYMLALEAFVQPAPQPGEWLITDYLDFQMICLQAASAFVKVLRGSESDAEVYQWIGRVLATAGFQQAAAQAFTQAEQVGYGESDEIEPQEHSELTSQFADEQPPAPLPPITSAEIDKFTERLKGPLPITQLWLDDDHHINN